MPGEKNNIVEVKFSTRDEAYLALPNFIKRYSERVAHNGQLLYYKLLEKGFYEDYSDLNKKRVKHIFDIIKYYDLGYVYEDGENTYSGKAIPQQHVQKGSEIFFQYIKTRENFKSLSEEERFIRTMAKQACFYHHERWDGLGYPEGLRMEEIPLIARITSICHGFETLTFPISKSNRLTKQEAIKEILSESNKAYDPLLAETLSSILDELVVEGDEITPFDESLLEEKVEIVEEEKTIEEEVEEQLQEIEQTHKPMEMIFTPVVDINSKECIYYKSEIILYDEYIGVIYPTVYAYVAEKTGQIVDIVNLGLNNILYVNKKVNKAKKEMPKVSLRLYESYIKKENFIDVITKMLIDSKVKFDQLILEVPESTFNDPEDKVIESIKMLRQLGAKIALTEFGKSYSSMNVLSKYDFDIVLIDKSYIKDIISNTKVGGMVRGFLELITQLDAVAVCEGVETEEQFETLRKYGYRYMQGSYFEQKFDEDSMISNFIGD